jgi:hypothetical protein
VAAIVTKVVSGETNYPEGFLEDYYSWLVNDSVCKDVFVTKDVKFGMEYGFILDPSAPLGVFVHACILSRVPSEVCAGQGRQEIWIKLVKDGVCWPLSVMFSYIRRDNGEYTVDNEYFERLTFNLFSYGSHSPYNLKEMSNLDLKRAVAGNLGGNSSQSYLRQWGCAYNDCSTWGGCFALFNSNAVQGLNRKAIEAYDKELKAKYGTKEEKQWGETVVRWLKRPPSEVFYPTALKHILALQEEIFTLIAKKEKKEAKVA